MAEHGRQGASRLATALSDVVEGVRVVSHNSLALLGLCGAVVIALLVGSPQWRHQAEDRALTWLMDRANARVAAAEVEPEAVLMAMAEPEAIQRATAAPVSELSAQQAKLTLWIARRYSVPGVVNIPLASDELRWELSLFWRKDQVLSFAAQAMIALVEKHLTHK